MDDMLFAFSVSSAGKTVGEASKVLYFVRAESDRKNLVLGPWCGAWCFHHKWHGGGCVLCAWPRGGSLFVLKWEKQTCAGPVPSILQHALGQGAELAARTLGPGVQLASLVGRSLATRCL